MAKFAPQFIQGLINPAYLSGMFTAAQDIGAAPRLAKMEAERKALLTQENQLFQQGIHSTMQDYADPNALRKRISQLSDLMVSAKNESDRTRIGTRINSLTQLLEQTTNRAKVNQVQSVISAENAVDQLNQTVQAQQFEETDQFVGPAAIMAGDDKMGERVQLERDNAVRARDALQQRARDLRANPEIDAAANAAVRQKEFTRIKEDAEILGNKVTLAVGQLSSLPAGSPQREKMEKQLIDLGLGQAVSIATERDNALLEHRLTREKLLKDTAPITKEQEKRIKEMGLTVNLTTRNKILAADEDARFAAAYRAYEPMDKIRADAVLTHYLNTVKAEGDYFDLPFWDDIAEAIEDDLTDEDRAMLLGLITDKPEVEAIPIIDQFLKTKFPKQFDRSKEYIEEKRKEAAATEKAIQETLIYNREKDISSLMEKENISREDAEEKYYADPKREMDLFKAQRAVQEARARRFARNVGAVGFGLD